MIDVLDALRRWGKRGLAPVALFFGIAVLAAPLAAQQPPPVEIPDLQLRTTGFLTTIEALADGSVVIGGSFDYIDGEPRNNLARIRADGSLDPDWVPKVPGTVTALAVDAAGTVFAGGTLPLTGTGGSANRAWLGRIAASTGELDSGWAPSLTGTANSSFALTSLGFAPDGQLIVAGSFAAVDGTARSNIAKLSTESPPELDLDWSPEVSGYVGALAIGEDGSVYIGGDFSAVNGEQRRFLAKLDSAGALVPQWAPELVSPVQSLLLLADGSLIVGGNLGFINGVARSGIAKLLNDATGTVDPVWDPSPRRGFLQVSAPVTAMALDANNRLYVAGGFDRIGGLQRAGLARISITGTGSADPTWDSGSTQSINAIAALANGNVYVGGNFDQVGGESRLGLAELDSTGAAVGLAYEALRDGQVSALVALPEGGAIVAGNFLRALGSERRSLLKLTPSGALDPLWTPTTDGVAHSIARAPDGALIIGGEFSRVNDQPRSGLARLASQGVGALDMDWNPGANNQVRSVAVSGDGYVYVGGSFTQIAGTARSRLARLSLASPATLDPGWAPNVANNDVASIAFGNAGEVFVGGGFSQIDGLQRPGLAKISAAGAVDPLWSPEAGFHRNLVVSGDFLHVDGRRIALSGDGATDSDWSAMTPSLSTYAQTVHGDLLFVGGGSSTVTSFRPLLAKIELSTGARDLLWRPAPDARVDALAWDGTQLLAGGVFQSMGGEARSGLGALPEQLSPPAGSADLAALFAAVPGAAVRVDSIGLWQVLLAFSGANSVWFKPVADEPGTSIRIDGELVDSGTQSESFVLTPGIRRFRLSTVNQSGSSAQHYPIEVVSVSDTGALLGLSIYPMDDGSTPASEFRIVLRNLGNRTLSNVRLQIPAPAGLQNVIWNCSASNGCAPGNGEGDIDVQLVQASGVEAAVITLSGEHVPDAAFVDVQARATGNDGGATVSAEASETVSANGIGILKSGFER